MTFKNKPIGQIIRDGVAFDPKNWTTRSGNPDSLIQASQDFFKLLQARKIEYVLVGGIALLNYVEGRNTQDLDLLMAASALKQIPELKITGEDRFFVRSTYGDLSVDILLTKNPLFKKIEKSYASIQKINDIEIRIATVEGLMLLKLYALPSLYRQGDFARVGMYENDVATLVQKYSPDLNILLEELSKYLSSEDLNEVSGIVKEIEGRIKRFESRAKKTIL